MELSDKITKNIKKKRYKKIKTYTIDPDICRFFEKFCDEKKLKYSQVIQELMCEFINK
jgi:hypothetical protein